MTRNNLAVFIDFENIGRADDFSVSSLIDILNERGRLVVKRAYADWGRFDSKYKQQMLKNAVELIEMPSHKYRGKNSADIKLVVDALETAFTKEHIGTFVVVSGDSDYTPLIAKLREYDKYVIVIGTKTSVGELLSGYCDELIYYRNITGQAVAHGSSRASTDKLLRNVINHLYSEGIETRSSNVKNYMKQFDEKFDEKHHGFSQFKEFLQDAKRRNIVELASSDHGEYLVTLTNKPASNSAVHLAPLLENSRKLELYSLVYYSLKMVESLPNSVSRQSVLAALVRQLDPDFSLPHYGYSNTQKFTKVLQDMHDAGLIHYEHDLSLNDYRVTATEKLVELAADQTEPPNYLEIWLRTHLSSLSISIRPEVIQYTLLTMSALLDSDPDGFLLSTFYEQFQVDSEKLSFSIVVVDRTLNLLQECEAINSFSDTIAIHACDEDAEGEEPIAELVTLITAVDSLEDSWRKVFSYLANIVFQTSGKRTDATEIAHLFGIELSYRQTI